MNICDSLLLLRCNDGMGYPPEAVSVCLTKVDRRDTVATRQTTAPLLNEGICNIAAYTYFRRYYSMCAFMTRSVAISRIWAVMPEIMRFKTIRDIVYNRYVKIVLSYC